MGLKKLFNSINDLAHPEATRKKKHRKKLKQVLAELKKKEAVLRDKLDSTKDDRKRDRLKKELDIVIAQHKRGKKALAEGG